MPMNSGRDYVAREVSVSQPLMAAGPVGGNQGGDFVVQAIPILEAGARTGVSTTDLRAGMGIGVDGDPVFTLQSGKQHAVAMSVAMRGREGGAMAELGGETAYALRASEGGGSDPYVLAPAYSIARDALDRSGEASDGTAANRPGLGVDVDVAATLKSKGPGAVAHHLAVCVTGSVTHTLRAEGFDASEDGTGRGQPMVVHGTQDPDVNIDFAHTLGRNSGQENALFGVTMAVRRLMPVECHLLQGFPHVLEWKFDEMTRDEVILAALMNGDIIVDAERGKVFGTRGPGGILLREPRELGCSMPNGYRVANLTANGVKRQVRLHRVVWMSVYGAIPEGLVPDHINNDKADNRIANLQLLTPKENAAKAIEDGCCDFDNSAATKLTTEVRAQVWCDYHSGGGTYKQLAEKYGVSPSRIGQIATQEAWCAVPTGPKGDKIAADGPQYKQLGNSWAVNHHRHVGQRLDAWLRANPSRRKPVIEMEYDPALLIWALAA